MGSPAAEQVETHALWLSAARASFGAPAVIAPETVVRSLRLSSASRDGGHRFFAGFFGVRESLLAAFILAARRNLGKLEPAVAFGALADLGDTALVLRELLVRRNVRPGAVFLLLSGLAGSAASTALWWEVRRARRAYSHSGMRS